jgi:hypothetical protein
MSRFLLALGLFASCLLATAQNIFPTSGNAGVGTNSPQALFEVRNQNPLGNTTGSNLLLRRYAVANATNYFMNNLWVRREGNGGDWLTTRLHDGISIDVSYLQPGVNTRTWWERNPFNNIQSWGTGDQVYLSINGGNVGIGTATPLERLELKSGNLKLDEAAGGGIGNIFFGGRSYLGENGLRIFYTGGNSFIDAKAPNNASGLIFRLDNVNGGTERMRINTDGNVGIGTNAPSSFRLAVAGKIGAWGEVRVFTTGSLFPDYVFAPTYRLMPLPEVEKYVKENQHLPEVPSAKEIEKEGMSLNEMNLILLKKVEELTLHLIEMEKRVKEQEQRIRELEETDKN